MDNLGISKSEESILYKLGDETKLSAVDDFDLKSSNSNKTDEYFEDKYISSENYGTHSPESPDRSTKDFCSTTIQDFVFRNVVYLGNGPIDDPKNEEKILEHIIQFNGKNDGFLIRLSVPSHSDGAVILCDEKTSAIIGTYEICRILFFLHGPDYREQHNCFAFTYSHGETVEDAVFQCLVFKCSKSVEIEHISNKFSSAFSIQRSESRSKSSLSSDESFTQVLQYNFDVLLDIKDYDLQSGFLRSLESYKNGFYLYESSSYQFLVGIQQVLNNNNKFLEILNCNPIISLCLCGPKIQYILNDFEITTKEVTMPSAVENKHRYNIYFVWECSDWNSIFEKDSHKSIETLDLKITLEFQDVDEPVELLLHFPVRLETQRTRFLDLNTKPLFQKFSIILNQIDHINRSLIAVSNITLDGEKNNVISDKGSSEYSLRNDYYNLEDRVVFVSSKSWNESLQNYEEPVLSGTDLVDDNCNVTDCNEIENKWHELLSNWDSVQSNNNFLLKLLREGIPQQLRLSFWLKITAVDVNDTLFESFYDVCASKKSPYETMIRNDVMRTFNGHHFFKQSGGMGQDEIFRVGCAYSVYDTQLGYCQGMSFIIAALLSHMTEKNAFRILIKVMFDYEIRKLYENSFQYLHLRLYQLNRLIEDQLPSLWLHFREIHIEPHMYASNWFLTVFTSRFPLYFVNKFLDLFFVIKTEAFFKVSLAILTVFRSELLMSDFEGCMKLFQIVIPKKCSKKVTNCIFSIVDDVPLNSIEVYEKSFLENDLFHDKEKDRSADLSNDTYEQYLSQIEALKSIIANCEEERHILRSTLNRQLEEQRDIAETESQTKSNIIQEYKDCFKTLEDQLLEVNTKYNKLLEQISSCQKCYQKIREFDLKEDNKVVDKIEKKKVHDLELELAKTKVLYAEAVCQNDNMAHQYNTLSSDVSELKSNNRRQWFNKAMETLKEVTTKSKIPNQSAFNTSTIDKH